MDKSVHIKLTISVNQKFFKRMNRKTAQFEKVFAAHVIAKGLIIRIYIKNTHQKKNSQWKEIQRGKLKMGRHLKWMIFIWPVNI